jgi:hypothetical protein
VGYSPLLWGLSYENVVPVVMGMSGMDPVLSAARSTRRGARVESDEAARDEAARMASLGLNLTKLDSTWAAIRRVGSFQWANQDPAHTAFMPTTHVNASGWTDPPPPMSLPPTPAPPQPTLCDAQHWLKGRDALTLGHGHDACAPRNGDTACANISTAASCCAGCKQHSHICASWFWNGATDDCSGHGCCYFKSNADNDPVTPPSDLFAAGYGSHHPSPGQHWCAYSGVFSTPDACPAYEGKVS